MADNFTMQNTTPSRVKIILILVAAILLYGLFAGIRANTSLLSTEISAFTGISYGGVSSSFSVLNLVFAISIPFVGILTLRIQKFYLLLSGAISCAIGFLGAAFSFSTIQLIIFIGIFFGLGSAFLSFTIVYSATRPFIGDKAGSIFAGVLLASQGVLGMVSSHAINGVIEGFGLTVCLLTISVLAVCLVPFTFLFFNKKGNLVEKKEEDKQTSISIKGVLKKILTNPFFYILALGGFAFGMGDGGLINHSAQYINELFETTAFSPFLVSIYSVSILAGALFGGFLGSRVKNKMLTCGIVYLAWAFVNFLIQLCIITNCFGMDIATVTIILTFTTGFLINVTVPLIVGIAADRVSLAVIAVVLAIVDFSTFIAYSFDSFLGGMLHDIFGNFTLIDSLTTLLALATGIIFVVYWLQTRKKKLEQII